MTAGYVNMAVLPKTEVQPNGAGAVESVVNPIGPVTTSAGLKVICQHDDTAYETAQSVSGEKYETIP
jgi:hypothetical protein